MSTTYTKHWFFVLILVVLCLSSTSGKRLIRAKRGEKKGESISFPYLYADRNNLNASYPVVEYIAPTTAKQLENDMPYFLYDPRQGYRVVVFVSYSFVDILRLQKTITSNSRILTIKLLFSFFISTDTGVIHVKILNRTLLISLNAYNKLHMNRTKK
jgi:hypothetical protein